MEQVATDLAAQGLLSGPARDYYVEQAQGSPVGVSVW